MRSAFGKRNFNSDTLSGSMVSSFMHETILYIRRYIFDSLFRILASIKIKFSQILQELKAYFSNLFLALM